GIGTLGGIVATFATGFVLVAAFATSTILIATAVVVSVVGALVLGYERRRAEPVPEGDRVPLRAGGRRPGPPRRPDAGVGHAAALVRRPDRPGVPGIRLHQ